MVTIYIQKNCTIALDKGSFFLCPTFHTDVTSTSGYVSRYSKTK